MWERESSLWVRSDYMDSTYYSPNNKQELLEKQERDRELREKFPLEFSKQLNLDSSNQEIKNDNQ